MLKIDTFSVKPSVYISLFLLKTVRPRHLPPRMARAGRAALDVEERVDDAQVSHLSESNGGDVADQWSRESGGVQRQCVVVPVPKTHMKRATEVAALNVREHEGVTELAYAPLLTRGQRETFLDSRRDCIWIEPGAQDECGEHGGELKCGARPLVLQHLKVSTDHHGASQVEVLVCTERSYSLEAL